MDFVHQADANATEPRAVGVALASLLWGTRFIFRYKSFILQSRAVSCELNSEVILSTP